jgi:hypothetical protein
MRYLPRVLGWAPRGHNPMRPQYDPHNLPRGMAEERRYDVPSLQKECLLKAPTLVEVVWFICYGVMVLWEIRTQRRRLGIYIYEGISISMARGTYGYRYSSLYSRKKFFIGNTLIWEVLLAKTVLRYGYRGVSRISRIRGWFVTSY